MCVCVWCGVVWCVCLPFCLRMHTHALLYECTRLPSLLPRVSVEEILSHDYPLADFENVSVTSDPQSDNVTVQQSTYIEISAKPSTVLPLYYTLLLNNLPHLIYIS